jgi:hypothetical protein
MIGHQCRPQHTITDLTEPWRSDVGGRPLGLNLSSLVAIMCVPLPTKISKLAVEKFIALPITLDLGLSCLFLLRRLSAELSKFLTLLTQLPQCRAKRQ